ncbi:DNA recombination protein RmuC [Chitinophaga skermanii]|uniref:DNA recombination protein RmuC n=1 Tax=Chitinophaga skermanii TaxID=331697 RepID=A0A327Q6F6_9BACT|nr:DNA recombination protein RmuC [Chitinophaga skermanii]RAI99377.1 DNA recombination protein RmuC [Chitinophaga skermanii]
MMEVLLLVGGLILGGLVGYFVGKLQGGSGSVSKLQFEQLQSQFSQLQIESAQKLSKQEVDAKYVSRELHQHTMLQLREQDSERGDLKMTVQMKDNEILDLNTELTALKKENEHLMDRMSDFKVEVEQLQSQAEERFKNIATEILRANSKEFTLTNLQSMDGILTPLKTDLANFKKTVEDTRKEDIQDITSLKKEIEQLHKLNNQLSEDAKNLAGALQADVKVQGSWGEERLRVILEAEGLQKYVDYTEQNQYFDEEQQQIRKPDMIIKLPDGNSIVIDSKVSLNAYVHYFNAHDPNEKKGYLKQLVRNITTHIDDLSAKNYHHLRDLKAPPFVFMFMHFESALTLALNEEPSIFERAIKKNIVIITPTTLIAAMKMVKMIWQKENRVQNVEEIFKQCGALYDKFVRFLDSMEGVGIGLENANKNYKAAMDHLKDGTRRGDTIIGRVERLRELEAKTTKQISPKYFTEIQMLDNDLSIVPTEDTNGANIEE